MKTLRIICFAAFAALTFTACEKDKPVEPQTGIKGILVLNNGNWGANDASLSLYDIDTKTPAGDLFFTANNRHLGDLGQDMAVVGDDLYISVNGSQVIFVTDRELKIKKTIVAEESGFKLSPRTFATGGGKVYVTYYEGYLGEIDPASYSVRTTAVGPNPDGVAYVGGKLYVANSGGYLPGFNNTVSVVDASSFKEVSTIEVNCNPAAVVAGGNGKYVYVNSFGNYADIRPKLQVIDVASSKVSDVDYTDVKNIAMGKDSEFLVVTGDYDGNMEIAGSIWRHDADANSKAGKFTDSVISPYYSISADPGTGYVFVGTSDYTTNGDVWWFDANGKLQDRFDSKGLNPLKVICFSI